MFGVAYKKDVSDMRESPALDIIELLHRRGAMVSYTDPYVPTLREGDLRLQVGGRSAGGEGHRLRRDLHRSQACSTTRRSSKAFPVVVDTRNALKGITADNIFTLPC